MSSAVFLAAAALALAQASQAAPAEPTSVVAPTGDVTSFPPEFFVEQRPNNALDMVARIPGFDFQGGGGGRGLSGAAGNVLIDGKRPVSKSDGLDDVLRRVPASQVARIDVIRGGAPGIDMQGRSVVANVVRRRVDSLTGAVSASNVSVLETDRNRPSLRMEGVRRFGERVLEGSLDLRFGDGNDRAYTDRVRRAASGQPLLASRLSSEREEREWAGTAALETPFLGGDVRVNTRLYRDTDATNESELRSIPVGLRVSVSDYVGRGGEGGLRYDRALSEQASLQAVFLQQWRDNHSVASSGADQSARSEQSGETVTGAVLKFRRSPEIGFESGGEVAYNWLVGESELIVGGVAAPVPGSAADVREQRGEAYGSLVWQPEPNLVIEGAVRFEASILQARGVEAEYRFLKPRAAVSWSPNPNRQLRLRLERQVGQLNFGDFLSTASLGTGFVTAGAARLVPTQVIRAEFVFEQRFWKEGSLGVSARHEHLTDVIDRVPLVSDGRVFDARGNIGDGVRQSLDANASVPLDDFGVAGGLIEVGGNLQRSEVVDPTTGERRELSGQGAFGWNARFVQDLPGLRVSYGMSASGGASRASYRFNGIETYEEEPYASAFVEYKPADGLTFRGELNNLTARSSLNSRDVHAGFRDEAPLDFVEIRQDERYRTLRISISKVLDFNDE